MLLHHMHRMHHTLHHHMLHHMLHHHMLHHHMLIQHIQHHLPIARTIHTAHHTPTAPHMHTVPGKKKTIVEMIDNIKAIQMQST